MKFTSLHTNNKSRRLHMKPYGKADIRSQVMKNGDFGYRLNDSLGSEESPESLKGTTDKGNTTNGGLQVPQRMTNQRQPMESLSTGILQPC
jgi:hypothetical protein